MVFAALVERHRAVAAKSGVGQHFFRVFRIVLRNVFNFPSVAPGGQQRHAVKRQRAGFIRADNGCAAQSLHGGQAAYYGVFLCHALYAYRQYNGDDGRKSFRNGGNRQRYGHHKYFHDGHLVYEPYDENHRAYCKRNYAEISAQLCEFFLQRSLSFFLTGQQVGDFAHFRLHSGGGNDGLCRSVCDGAARKHHVRAVAYRRVCGNDGVGVFFGGNGFARKRRFFRFKR